MTDDERERLIAGLRQVEYHAPWAWTGLRQVQAQLRLDGERIKALNAGLRDVLAVIGDSRGVDGYHLNGDIAPWDEVLGPDFDAAVALLTAARGRQGE